MPNRRIDKEVKRFIDERAACSSDRAASIYRQVKDKFENPCSIVTVERRVKKHRKELELRKLANTPTPTPSDKELIYLRQRYGSASNHQEVSLYFNPSYPAQVFENVIRLYDQVVSMRQELAELKEMIKEK